MIVSVWNYKVIALTPQPHGVAMSFVTSYPPCYDDQERMCLWNAGNVKIKYKKNSDVFTEWPANVNYIHMQRMGRTAATLWNI